MKRLISAVTAFSMAFCTVSALPQLPVNAVSNDDVAAEQLSMPVVSIDTLGNMVNTKESYTDAKVTIYDENGDIDTDNADISIRLRGNITLRCEKKSYKFKFPKKANPLSLGDGAGKSWNLVANFNDTSLLRNMTAYHIGDMLDGMPYSPNSRSVEVYVNGSYEGVYLLTEAVNVAKSRVSITEKPDLVEGNGYLVEMSFYECDTPFYIEHQQYDVKSDLSADEAVAKKQVEYISGYMDDALKALKNNDKEQAAQYIDIPSLVDNYIANEICKNVDSGWDSYYISKDAGGKLTFNPMWDYDLALGNFVDVKGYDSAAGLGIYNVSNCNANSNQWLCYAIRNDWFREAVAVRWKEIYSDVKKLPDYVSAEAEKNAASYERNFTKWKTLGIKVFSEPDEIAVLSTHKAHAEYLSGWLDDRISWLDAYFASEDWKGGVYPDENGKPIDTGNAVAVSTLMFWGGKGEIDVESPGFTADAARGGQALSTGIMLFKGQKYRLSFDCTVPDTASVNYRIQANHDSYKAYMSGKVAPDSTGHFKTEFTADTDDANCALVLEFKGSGTVKVEHLSLAALASETLMGDVNMDGEFNISDIVVFQKWLLAKPDTELKNWKAADLCGDGRLDVFDLCLMRRKLIIR